MDRKTNQKHLLRILTDAVKNKIYGSVEIYFEEGRMTQITQRVINKISAKPKEKKLSKDRTSLSKSLNKTREDIQVPSNSLEI